MRRLQWVVCTVGALGWLSGCGAPRVQTRVDQVAAPSHAVVAPPLTRLSVAMASPAASAAPSNALPVVYFTSMVGCAACDLVRPTVRAVARQYAGDVTLVTLDMSSARGERQAAALGVRGYPVLVLHDRHGKEVIRMFGVPKEDRIERGFALLATTP